MNRASPVDLRKCLEAAHGLAHIGIRFVPIPAATRRRFATGVRAGLTRQALIALTMISNRFLTKRPSR
nr:DUF1382 family protein [Raoultella planticola]